MSNEKRANAAVIIPNGTNIDGWIAVLVDKILIEAGEDVGLATVYRVLNQFDDAGVVERHHFEGGKSVFELNNKQHHDHLVCLKCGKVVEFADDVIEQCQRDVAAKHMMKLTNHSLYLYGECKTGCD